MTTSQSDKFLQNIQDQFLQFPPPDIHVVQLITGNLGILHTVGMHQHELPELLLVDLPVAAINTFAQFALGLCCQVIQEAGDTSKRSPLYHGCKMGRDLGCWVAMLQVEDPQEHAKLMTILSKCNPNSQIYLVKPLFDEWTVLPGAPDNKTELQEHVLETWINKNSTTGFFLFRDGNKENHDQTNILCVSGYAMFQNPSCCDWDDGLTSLQVQYVQDHWNHFLYMGVGCLERIPMDLAQAYISTVAEHVVNWQYWYGNDMKLANGGKYSWDMTQLETFDKDEQADIPELACAVCGKNKAFMCSKCNLIMYCSIQCQKLDWCTHKFACGK